MSPSDIVFRPASHRELPAFVALLVAAALASCASAPRPQAHGLFELGEALARSICPGPPTRITDVANTHYPEYVDRIETRACPQGTSQIYIGELASDPTGLMMSVEVIAPSAGLPRHLEIGQPVASAVRALGSPMSRIQNAVTYPLSPESDSTMTISHEGGRITSVLWGWAID
jgi:hypothetical protein